MAARYWEELPTTAFGDLPNDTVAVLPLGAIEQHGPHLPVCVDSCINAMLLDRAMKSMPQDASVLALPMQSVGKSNEHLAFAGTLSLTAQTLLHVIMELGEAVKSSGIRRMLLLNSHGGQPQVLDIAARDLRVKHGLFVVNAAWSGLGMPSGLFSDHECRHGIHGGEVETSLMLHLRPDLVDMTKAEDFVSLGARMEEEYKYLTPEGGVGFGWQAQDLNPAGACGNAARADAERGRQLAEHSIAAFHTLIDEIARFPLSNFENSPALRGTREGDI